MKKKYWVIIAAIFIADQITKMMVSKTLFYGQKIKIIEDFFYLTFHKNSGAAWGSFQGKMLFFYIITFFALVAFFHFIRQSKEKEVILRYGLILMIGGTFGNFFDRVVFQEVVDFLDFYIFGYNFPIFNIADISLVVGAGLVILESALEVWREKKYGKN